MRRIHCWDEIVGFVVVVAWMVSTATESKQVLFILFIHKGIPKFYRWLSERFPVINQELEAEYEFDNFYLDMNGIIHLCTHNNNSVQLVWDNVEEMFDSIFEYTDR